MKNKTKKQTNTFKAIFLVLGCLAFLPQMQAVNPPPDGCYPNFTTAEGCNALQNLTTGAGNTGVGWYSLFGTSTGGFNTGVGAGTLTLNNSDSNTAVGTAALLLNTAGLENSALGTAALVNNDNGDSNTAVGAFALQTNTIGGGNTAVGHGALQNSNGDFLTAIGANAGTDPDIVSNNVYISDPGFPADENVISIGGISASGIDFTATFIGGIYGAQVNTGSALPVYVDTDGHLGTTLVNGSFQKLRMRSPKGAQPQVKASEFQKQQKRIAELEATVTRLVATVKEQASQIEKVSAQLELQKPAGRVVANKR
ncbi:MAG TPA: hypothetical protein VL912_09760 [Candidatus Udaeobacter sp.]|nr:hypothetical protein [Candidatus Udaeobacter sp.]